MRRITVGLTIIGLCVCVSAQAESLRDYQIKSLEAAAREEKAEGDRDGGRDFERLARIAKEERLVTLADLPLPWRECSPCQLGKSRDTLNRILALEARIAAMSDAEKAACAESIACMMVDLFHARHELTEKRTHDDSAVYVAHAEQDLGCLSAPPAPAMGCPAPIPGILPPDAAPGHCYARVYLPPETKTETVRVLIKEASERTEIAPAQFEWAEEKVLTKQASSRVEEVPAEYGWVEEQILSGPEHTMWTKGCMPTEQGTVAETWCLMDVPANYTTVRRQVVTKPCTTREIEIPAEYQTVRVQKMVTPPQVKRIPIPEEYAEVSKQILVCPGRFEWREVLCEKNASADKIIHIQESLQNAGYDPGPIDGTLGPATLVAVRAFQEQHGLATGALTVETVEALEEFAVSSELPAED